MKQAMSPMTLCCQQAVDRILPAVVLHDVFKNVGLGVIIIQIRFDHVRVKLEVVILARSVPLVLGVLVYPAKKK